MSQRWRTLDSEKIFEMGYLKIRIEKCEMPDGRIMPKYFIVDFTDWVQVVALTKDKKMILVRQYRHAARETCLELPGGAMSMRVKESPDVASRRELLEETGYDTQGDLEYLGFHYPNPALQSNKIHVYLARDCERVAEQSLDPYEDLTVEFENLDTVFQKLEEGAFTHSLMVPSLVLAKKALGLK